MKRAVAAIALTLVAIACSGEPEPSGSAPEALIAVNAALGTDAGRQIERGAQLAIEQINDAGGVRARDRTHRLGLTTLDTKSSAVTAADNARAAIQRGAVAIVGDGDGVGAVQEEAARLGVPLGIMNESGGPIDPAARRAVFRVAPKPEDLAVRMRELLVPSGLTVTVLHDDGAYGSNGLEALAAAFEEHRETISGAVVVPADSDGETEVGLAISAGAQALLIWMPSEATARIVRAAREAGWTGPIYTGPSGADPAVRVAMKDRPDRVSGLIFAAGRLAGGPDEGDYERFRRDYEKRFGPSEAGVKQQGRTVIDPPRTAMYAYDFVRMVAAAMTEAGTAQPGSRLTAAMESVTVDGANGAVRRFTATDHDAVERDEIFFARFADFVWVPVKDDPRSANLPDVPQIR